MPIGCRKLPNSGDFRVSTQIKSLFFSHKNVWGFLFVSHFLNLHKVLEKMAKSAIAADFMSISPFALTFQRSFCEKPLLKTALRNVLRVVYALKQS